MNTTAYYDVNMVDVNYVTESFLIIFDHFRSFSYFLLAQLSRNFRIFRDFFESKIYRSYNKIISYHLRCRIFLL